MSKTQTDLPVKRYVLEGVSSTKMVAVKDENLAEIKRSQTQHQVFHFSLLVESTNRAAMSEYLLVMRPVNSGRRAYEYLTRTAVVLNQVQEEDINTPILELSEDGKLFVKLKEMTTAQKVIVVVTRFL